MVCNGVLAYSGLGCQYTQPFDKTMVKLLDTIESNNLLNELGFVILSYWKPFRRIPLCNVFDTHVPVNVPTCMYWARRMGGDGCNWETNVTQGKWLSLLQCDRTIVATCVNEHSLERWCCTCEGHNVRKHHTYHGEHTPASILTNVSLLNTLTYQANLLIMLGGLLSILSLIPSSMRLVLLLCNAIA